jgi:hypothetical protein
MGTDRKNAGALFFCHANVDKNDSNVKQIDLVKNSTPYKMWAVKNLSR